MFVPQHAVKLDLADSRRRYEFEAEAVQKRLEILRDPSRVDLLTSLAHSAEVTYHHGLLISAAPRVCAWALAVAARANTAAFVFSDLKASPRPWRLDNGPPYSFYERVDESSVHSGRWVDAISQAVVARQVDCLIELRPIAYDALRRSSSRSSDPERDRHRVEQHRALAEAALDPDRPLAPDYLIHAAAARPAKVRPINRRIGEANDRMVNALDVQDAAKFNAALAESLELRRTAFADLPEETKGNHTALWPLGLIALVVLAHDRGIPIEVESDYLPRPWVTGELFQESAAS
ncbi:hypothetical protein GobsT_13170 [Gemmata obscuriglobus]|uniref:Uncharacterized protein n=1 Tax=Gemmata obscuriglobus TaxID=114 RepID=A0A2Z3H5R0_9BACT|nr:immunity 49 family protein [Gemmata obscuriglobus]AWM40231.1 hypothetical protein C1280_26655 [Gemmata obscuriglobus]QEG26576.1 hypothetical protein GobsT_13170 [Gemmata obscuriglobus]VTS02014.1 Uncharacterized protein OS=Gloeobacter kilaueensis JS1 GN=GKIL_0098 PE=4 SV=1: Imm29 [Gemmata obscuriglobus UQM 2246]